jgi:hypothetical protein
MAQAFEGTVLDEVMARRHLPARALASARAPAVPLAAVEGE